MHFTKLFTFVCLATSSLAISVPRAPITPASGAGQTGTQILDGTSTDVNVIVGTLHEVDQKTGPTDNAPPSDEVPPTVITAVDGQVTTAGQSGDALLEVLHGDIVDPSTETGSKLKRRDHRKTKRILPGYTQVFSGTGTGPDDRDASIQGTAYLTYKLLSDATYDVDGCLAECNNINGCVFANIYYEHNNNLELNGVQTTLKCALYADVHSAAEKTNFGGQQLLPPPAGLTYIQHSSGYAVTSFVDPAVPEGYEFVFGPTTAANDAPGYMGFALLDKYDVQACANLCNARTADTSGGMCKYFNVWRAVENGNPVSYTCAMYFTPTDASTATFTGSDGISVTASRGYRRINYVTDGGFEEYTGCDSFCFAASYAHWTGTSSPGGNLDATIFHYAPYAYVGSSVALLGSATGADNLPGTLTSNHPLNTAPGKTYTVSFFQDSTFSGPSLEANSIVNVVWNGVTVLTITPGYLDWTHFSVDVVAAGNDVLAFHGGRAPAWTFIDEIYVFLK
ncbi:hypothetical protein AX16_010015 [Volvariella volvacea WC 439]|nr:hypothetical protein AX16_010015 [Volvariella volvacea WC 439]